MISKNLRKNVLSREQLIINFLASWIVFFKKINLRINIQNHGQNISLLRASISISQRHSSWSHRLQAHCTQSDPVPSRWSSSYVQLQTQHWFSVSIDCWTEEEVGVEESLELLPSLTGVGKVLRLFAAGFDLFLDSCASFCLARSADFLALSSAFSFAAFSFSSFFFSLFSPFLPSPFSFIPLSPQE